MSGYLQMLPFMGQAISGVCDVGSNLVDGVVGREGLFARTLDALSGSNPFRGPNVAPGERAEEMEAQLMRLEQLLAESKGMLLEQAGMMALSERLGEVAKVLDGADLTSVEREQILARILAFLSNKNIAERMGTFEPEAGELIEEIAGMLRDYDVPENERLPLLQQIDDILNGVEDGRTAA